MSGMRDRLKGGGRDYVEVEDISLSSSSSRTVDTAPLVTFSFLGNCTLLGPGCSSLVCPSLTFSVVSCPSLTFSVSFFGHFSALAPICELPEGHFSIFTRNHSIDTCFCHCFNTSLKCLTAFSSNKFTLHPAFTLLGW